MTTIFMLQLICCTITILLAVQLVVSSLQVRWKVGHYEASRWLLCIAMGLFTTHYILQMVHGLRAQGADVGAAFNILFYTPAAFAITLSIIYVERIGGSVRRYCLRSAVAYLLILATFAVGVVTNQSYHIGNLLYVMLGLFVVSMAYFIFVSRREIALRKQRLLEDSGIDLLPYVRYAKASISLLYLTAALLPVTILYNTLLIIIGPLMILNIVFFVQSFISLGYYITPSEEILGGKKG